MKVKWLQKIYKLSYYYHCNISIQFQIDSFILKINNNKKKIQNQITVEVKYDKFFLFAVLMLTCSVNFEAVYEAFCNLLAT